MCWHLRHIFLYIEADFNVFNAVVLKLISRPNMQVQSPQTAVTLQGNSPDGKAMPTGRENDLVATSTHQLLEKILY